MSSSEVDAPSSSESSETQRFVLDTKSERAALYLRGTSMVITLVGAGWLVALGPGPVGWTVAGLGLLAALGWGFTTTRGRGRLRDPENWYLELNRLGLTLAEGTQAHQVDWKAVTEVETDENRLVAVVRRDALPDLVLEPRYRDQSVYELTETVRQWWRDATVGQPSDAPHVPNE